MADNTLQEQLIARIKTLTDEQLKIVLRTVEEIGGNGSDELPTDYDPDEDPLIGGFISGPTDLSERYKQILRDEIDPRSGWTTKKDKLP